MQLIVDKQNMPNYALSNQSHIFQTQCSKSYYCKENFDVILKYASYSQIR